MADARRIPGFGSLLAGLLLLGTLVGVWWWQFRPKPEAPTDPAVLGQLDVVCIGRVDGLHPVITLEPIVPGKVFEVMAVEGKPVRARDPLLKLDTETAQLRVDEAQAALDAANADVRAAKQEAAGFPVRKENAAAAVKAAAARRQAAQKLLEERKLQQKFMTVTPAELAASEAEVKQYEVLEAAELARERELANADPQIRVEAAEARSRAAAVAYRQAEKAVRDCVLTAPTDGTVLRVLVSVGESVAPGGLQPAVVFRPTGPLVVRAELDQEFLGRVQRGMKATVRDDARADSPTWSGRIDRVGAWVARKRSVVLEPGEVNDVRTVECVVLLDGSTDGLLVGQRVRVRIGGADK